MKVKEMGNLKRKIQSVSTNLNRYGTFGEVSLSTKQFWNSRAK